MNDDKNTDQKRPQPSTFAAQDVRQAAIIPKRHWLRPVFIGGLLAVILVIMLLRFVG